MIFRQCGLLLAFFIACTSQAIAAEDLSRAESQRATATYSLEAEGDIVIALDGSVKDYTLTSTRLTPEIAAAVDKRVRSWRFEPIVVDGKAVNAKTSMRLDIRAEPHAGGYQLRVTNVYFGAPQRMAGIKPPKYPLTAMRAGVEADVVLIVTMNAAGEVIDVVAEQTSLSGTGPDRVVQQWREMFEKSAMDAAKRWNFAITETIDGEPAATSRSRVPVSYRMSDNDGWRAMIPVRPKDAAPEDDAGQLLSNSTALRDGETQSLTSRFKLKDDVVGSLL